MRVLIESMLLATAMAFSPDARCPAAPLVSPVGAPQISCSMLIDRRSALLGASTLCISSLASSPAYAVAPVPEWTLEGGVKMPTLALNTVGLSVEDTERAVRLAMALGVTHVDFHPGKERDGVARVLRSVDQSSLFLTTKIRKAPPGTSPAAAAEATESQIEEDLQALGVKSVDMLMLRDSPDRKVIQAQWAVLEKARKSGKARSIGVINFCQSALSCVLETATVKPAVNYYMLHVGMGPDPLGLRTFGESNGIRTFGYGAVGEPGPSEELLSSPALNAIGAAHGGRSNEEVALRWALQNGVAVSVRPTTNFGLGMSTCTDGPQCNVGMTARAQTFDWSLTSEEMKLLNSMTSPGGNPTLFSSTGCPNSYFANKA